MDKVCAVCKSSLISPWVQESTLGEIHTRCIKVGMLLMGSENTFHTVLELQGDHFITEIGDWWPDVVE